VKKARLDRLRVFLVGCPRSGTTLLQSILAAHPNVLSLPESHFFAYLVPRVSFLRPWGIASLRIRRRFHWYLNEIGEAATRQCLPRFAVSMRCYCEAYVAVLDRLTEDQGKTVWIEKTPRHLWYLSYIKRYVPDARFIHILRKGAEVVASLYQVTQEHPKAWSGRRSVDQCIDRWIKDVRISLANRHDPDHKLLRISTLSPIRSAWLPIFVGS